MSVSIIIGGQYGSEGKGKVAYKWAEKVNAVAVVRVGGSNSGHTVYVNNKKYALRMLPTASLLQGVTAVLPAGAYIDVEVLKQEIALCNLDKAHLKIDPNAVIIQEQNKKTESSLGLQENIGSTLSGTGSAVIDRVKRDINNPALMAQNIAELKDYVVNTKEYLRDLLIDDKEVVIEGTQGYGLSNYHAEDYPFATSRDTTAAVFLAETGLSPFDVKHIIMVIRSYPIRVAGHSGPFIQEIDWDTVTNEAGAEQKIIERTTVTENVRRVARFSPDIVKEAIRVNQPNIIVLNHMDYLDYKNKNKAVLSTKQYRYVSQIEREIGAKIQYCGNGEMSMIEMRGVI